MFWTPLPNVHRLRFLWFGLPRMLAEVGMINSKSREANSQHSSKPAFGFAHERPKGSLMRSHSLSVVMLSARKKTQSRIDVIFCRKHPLREPHCNSRVFSRKELPTELQTRAFYQCKSKKSQGFFDGKFRPEESLRFIPLRQRICDRNRGESGWEPWGTSSEFTVVAEMVTEFIRFEPEICICNGN